MPSSCSAILPLEQRAGVSASRAGSRFRVSLSIARLLDQDLLAGGDELHALARADPSSAASSCSSVSIPPAK